MNIKAFLKKNSSTILTITSVVGVVVTAISTANATIKATQLITEKEDTTGESLTTKDKMKLVVPAYIPPVLFGVCTVTCIVGSNILNKKSQASMMSAYALIDQSYKDYKRKLKELYGEEAHERILDELNAERAEKRYISNSYMFSGCDTYVENPNEKLIFYDEYSDRFFETTIIQVMQAEYHLNRNYILGGEACLNELYDLLGLKTTEFGSLAGWVPDDEGKFWIEFNHRKAKLPDGTVYYILEMPFAPSTEYDADWNYPRY